MWLYNTRKEKQKKNVQEGIKTFIARVELRERYDGERFGVYLFRYPTLAAVP